MAILSVTIRWSVNPPIRRISGPKFIRIIRL
jgi:hypothetical protein